MPVAPRLARALALLVLCPGVATLAGCGRQTPDQPEAAQSTRRPVIGPKGSDRVTTVAAAGIGLPELATKNTTRVAGADPTAEAAGIARAVYPGTRPGAVTLVDAKDWRGAVAASVFMSDPVRAPVLLSDGATLPPATQTALDALAPTGAKAAGDAQVLRVGDVARPATLRSTDIRGRDPFALARAIDAVQASATGATSDRVVIASADDPAYAMPAAAWAAKSGDPVLFTHRAVLPPDTRAALATHQQPKIYVLGPSKVIGPAVTSELRKLGTVVRVGGEDPVANAIAFARFSDGDFGWGVVDPGHGLVFARADADPATAAAAAPLSATGTYGPLLLLSGPPATLPSPVAGYLKDIQPGYTSDPTRGVYNRAWVIGDEKAVALTVQAQIDQALEIVPVKASDTTTTEASP